MTKSEKLRRASKACWLIGCVMTVNFIRVVLSATIPDPIICFVAAGLVSAGLQYVLTLMESSLFDGSLPPPWQVKWTEGGPIPFLVGAAVLCLAIDVMLNIGGVGMFMSRFEEATANDVFTISAVVMNSLKIIGTVLLSVLFALGSELLDAYADLVEGNPRKSYPVENRQPKRTAQEVPSQQQARDQQRARVAQQVQDQQRAQAIARTVNSDGSITRESNS